MDDRPNPDPHAARAARVSPLRVATTAWRWRSRPALAAGGLLLVTAVALGNPAANRLALFGGLSALALLAFSFAPRPTRRITLSPFGVAVEDRHARVDYAVRDLRATTLEDGTPMVEVADGPLLVGRGAARRFPRALVLREADLAAIWEHLRAAQGGTGPK
jgi:hypothetical protein